MIAVIFYIVYAFALMLVFQKLGREPWEAIVPIYNISVLIEETLGRRIYTLLLLIPIVNLVVLWKAMSELSSYFGKDTAFTAGLFFLTPIFMCILGFENKY